MLSKLIQSIEQNIGAFSSYQTSVGHGQNIPFGRKPAQQLIQGLGGKANSAAPLSEKEDESPLSLRNSTDVTIRSFENNNDSLTIPAKRIDRLLKHAKTYVNTAIFPEGLYQKLTCSQGEMTIGAQDHGCVPDTCMYWQNLAVGLCHVQEIDLLVEQVVNQKGQAIAHFRQREIKVDDPAILLLSSPALNFGGNGYGLAKDLPDSDVHEYLEGMYRNLFDAALQEGRTYVTLPAAGLGVFEGDPDTYFTALMKIAKEYPELNIIYHPAQFVKAFDQALEKAQLPNIVKATKDVLFIADALTRAGYPCAMHNPSDADVVYGVYDVGEYWKSGKGNGYVGEEHIGAMTTAPINSLKLNPSAYHTVVERNLRTESTAVLSESLSTDTSSTSTSEEDDTQKLVEVNDATLRPSKARQQLLDEIKNLKKTLKSELQTSCFFKETKDNKIKGLRRLHAHFKEPNSADTVKDFLSAAEETFPKMLDGYFSKRVATIVDKVRNFDEEQNLSYEQLKKVEALYKTLNDEAGSWLCSNKALKIVKMKALDAFIDDCKKMPVLEAIEMARAKEGALDGCSSRVAALFDALEEEINQSRHSSSL